MNHLITGIFGLIFGAIIGLSWHQHRTHWVNEAQAAPANIIYNHDDEGRLLQEIELSDHEDYAAPEGSVARLYQLDQQCKININMYGETAYILKTFYFQKNTVLHAKQSRYHYLNGGLSNPENDGKLQDELYAEEIFNPNAAGLKYEFGNLIRQFKPALIQNC